MLRLFLLIPLILLCSGCSTSPAPPATYEPPPKPGGRLCAFQCRKAQEHCQESCKLMERSCVIEMQSQAIRDYEAYAREQFRARASADLRPSDFERPEQCFSSACRDSCQTTYDACFEKCGGKVIRPSAPLLSLF